MPRRERHFLGWDAPFPQRAAAWLLNLHLSPDAAVLHEADLSRTLIITPTARSGRLLLGELVDAAEARGAALAPPIMLTPAELPGAVLDVPGEPAPPLLRLLAWMRTLGSTSADELAVLLSHAPAPGQAAAWMSLAELVVAAHDELARHTHTLADAGAACDFDPARWQIAAQVGSRAAELLASWGCVDGPHSELAALKAGRWRTRPEVDFIVLAGVTDISPAVRTCLEHAAHDVIALVGAPQDLASACDEFGLVRPEAWPLPELPEHTVLFADDPAHAAELAFGSLADVPQPVSASDVCMVAADPALARAVELKADEIGTLRVRPAPGPPALRSSPGQLIEVIESFLDSASAAAALDLVRHPDTHIALQRADAAGAAAAPAGAKTLAAELARALPDGVTHWLTPGPRFEAAGSTRPRAAGRAHPDAPGPLESLRRAVHTLLSPGGDPENGVRWVRDVLRFVYADSATGPRTEPRPDAPPLDDHAREALARILAKLAELEPATPVPARTVLALLKRDLARAPVPSDHDPGAIEVIGWLELAFDPARAVVVIGVNEGLLPAPTPEHPLLSTQVRRALRMDESAARLARDAFLLSAAGAARPHLRLISMRRDASGDPLHPSRLIMGGTDEAVAARVVRFARPDLDAPRRAIACPGAAAPATRPTAADQPLRVMGVTWFREYIESPRLFALRRVQGLTEGRPPARTFDALGFGTLIHDVARRLADADLSAEADRDRVASALHDELDRLAGQHFAGEPARLLDIQLSLARRRIEILAGAHAARARQGWRVAHAEWSPGREVRWPADDHPILLRGRIDRIEVHASGSVAIIDYKTSKKQESPEAAHRSARGWIDLQLPMYRHLAKCLLDDLGVGIDDVTLAYISLPDVPPDEPFLAAEWSPADLREADEKAREVIGCVRRAEFDDVNTLPREGTFSIVLQPDDINPVLDDADGDDGEDES
ncbi:MAG: PD-(D/E)XK nuclease family protein [Phycisphaerales bacterium]|nr:PD-(D/E)XK nuclease family protein [Phycisphaerales bacterium]